MNGKTILKALGIKARQCHAMSKVLAKSYVSLFLVLVLGVTAATAWFTEHESATIKSSDLQFQSASSLRINDDDVGKNTFHIPEFTLDEASSLDGRNIFFPVGENFLSNDSNFNTANMHFREANVGDRITDNNDTGWYVYKDVNLGGSSQKPTDVYIKGYKVTVQDAEGDTDNTNDSVNGVYQDQLIAKDTDNDGKLDKQELPPDNCAIRIAFIDDSGHEPKVIDPSAQVIDYVDNSKVVNMIDKNGTPQLKTSYGTTTSFASYYFGTNNPLFTIPQNHNLGVTLVVWLEGTLPNCDKYIGKRISVDIDIESNFSAMEEIKFIDKTAEKWVDDDETILVCSYENPYSKDDPKEWKTVVMTKASDFSTSYTWTARIPRKVVTNIAFYRLCPWYSGEPQGTIWNAWHTCTDVNKWKNSSEITETLDITREQTDGDGNKYNALEYTALDDNGYGKTTDTWKRLSPGLGFWDYTGAEPTPSPTESGGGSSSGNHNCHIILRTNGAKFIYDQHNNADHPIPHLVTRNGIDICSFTASTSESYRFDAYVDLSSGDVFDRFFVKYSQAGTTNNTFTMKTPLYTVPSGSGDLNITVEIEQYNQTYPVGVH